ncbi:MAG TPA: FtsX-like permease family protein [Candidatus Dormibacteraeota bacterium]|nr:FtsX-like permease family protein [Candidatus Dormibacteraeota bacterium]
MKGLLLFGGLFLVAYASLAVIALRRPLFARIAIREATRRPWQSALVVAGLMIGSGAILVSEVYQNSQDDSLTAAAFQSWGRVDLTVGAPDNSYFDPTIAQTLANDPLLRQSAVGVQAGVELVGSAADLDRRSSNGFVRVIGFDPLTQAPFGKFRLLDGAQTTGENLQAGQVFIGESLAASIGAKAGDHLRVSIGQSSGDAKAGVVTVAGVLAPVGPGSYGLRPGVFVPLQTVAGLIGTSQVNIIRLAAPGDGQSELDAGHRLVPIVAGALTRLPAASQLQVREAKADDINAARLQQDPGNFNGGFTGVLSGIVLLAGLVLVVNLMATLVEERRPRLAVLRALGLSRLGLIAALTIEGALYSLVAAVLGIVPGLLVSWALLVGTVRGSGGGGAGAGIGLGRDVQVQLSVRPSAVALAIAAGAAVTLAAVVLAAVLRSDMTIAAAIRDLPEPVSLKGGSVASRVLQLGLVVGSLIALFPGGPLRLVGGTGLITFAALAMRGRIPDRARLTGAGLALAAWALTSMTISFSTTGSSSGGVELFLALPVTALGLSLAAVNNLRLLENAASAVGDASGRLRATLRLALAYLARRPLRASLTVGTLAMLLSVIVIYNVLIVGFGNQARQSHAQLPYDITVFMPAQRAMVLPPAVQAELATSVSIPTRTYLGAVQVSSPPGTPAIWHQEHLSLYELTPELVRNPPTGTDTTNRLPRFPDDAAAWRTVENDPGWVFWTRFNSEVQLTLVGSEGPVTRYVAADVGDPILDGIIGSPQGLAPFGNLPLGTTVLVKTRPGVNPQVVAAQIRQALLADGAEVTAITDLFKQTDVSFQLFASVPVLFMRMGMVIGILSLAILALRAVVQRRRSIGVLRALGYRRGEMVAAIMAEATLTLTCGALVGTVTGIAAAYLYVNGTSTATSFGFDIVSLAGTLALMYVAVLLATFGPALAAARTSPGQALRLQE